MKCKCGERMACVDSREYGEGTRRRYKCKTCGEGATTFESIVEGETRGRNNSVEKAYKAQNLRESKGEFLKILRNFVDTIEKI